LAYLESNAALADVKARYESTSVYDLEGDLVMCREHIQACRILIGRTADETRQGSAALRESYAKYKGSLDAALKWLAAVDPGFASGAGAGSVRLMVPNVRDY